MGLLLVAQRRVEILKRRLHRLRGGNEGVEAPLHRFEATDRSQRRCIRASRLQCRNRLGGGISQPVERGLLVAGRPHDVFDAFDRQIDQPRLRLAATVRLFALGDATLSSRADPTSAPPIFGPMALKRAFCSSLSEA
jgi:hypothetical protein